MRFFYLLVLLSLVGCGACWFFVPNGIPYNVYSLNVNASKLGQLTTNINVERTDKWTMSVWFKANTTSPGWLFGNMNSSLSGLPGIRLGYASTDVFLNLRGAGGTILKTGGSTPTVGTWTMFTVTCSGSSTAAGVKFYLNDVLTAVATTDDTLTASMAGNGITYVGAEYDANGPFDGKIDEFKWYSSELSASDVAALYAAYSPSGSGNIVGLPTYASVLTWLRMKDGGGDTATNVVNQKTPGTYDMTVAGGVSGDYTKDVP